MYPYNIGKNMCLYTYMKKITKQEFKFIKYKFKAPVTNL